MEVSTEALRLLDNLVGTNLQELRDSYFHWLLFFTGVVAMGVVLEETESLPFTKARFDPSIGLPVPRCGLISWMRWFTRIGWVMIVTGVIGEGTVEALISKADGLLQSFNNSLVSEAQK